MGRARQKRSHRTLLASRLQAPSWLTDLDALLAPFLATHATHPVLAFDPFTVGAVLMIVIDLAMLRRVLRRVRVIGHSTFTSSGEPCTVPSRVNTPIVEWRSTSRGRSAGTRPAAGTCQPASRPQTHRPDVRRGRQEGHWRDGASLVAIAATLLPASGPLRTGDGERSQRR